MNESFRHDGAPTVSLHAMSAPSLSVVLSFWNEEEVLPELIGRLRDTLRVEVRAGRLSRYELIFVNDASTDCSLDVLLEATQGEGDIRIVDMSRNFGVSPCVMAGMQHSTGDLVVYMDADLQDPPEVIPELLALRRADPSIEVVHTVRRKRRGESKFKLFLTGIGYSILQYLSSVPIRREAGDFKLLSRRVVDHLVQLREQKPFIRGLVSWVGFHQAEFAYERDARHAGETKCPVLGAKVIRNFLESAVISFSDVPVYLALILGVISTFTGAGFLTYALFAAVFGWALPAWVGIVGAVTLIGGLQISCLGLIGLYVAGTYFASKRRPNHIVKETYGFEATDSRRSAA